MDVLQRRHFAVVGICHLPAIQAERPDRGASGCGPGSPEPSARELRARAGGQRLFGSTTRSPSALSHPLFGWEGFPTKIDYGGKQKTKTSGTLILTSLLEDLASLPAWHPWAHAWKIKLFLPLVGAMATWEGGYPNIHTHTQTHTDTHTHTHVFLQGPPGSSSRRERSFSWSP